MFIPFLCEQINMQGLKAKSAFLVAIMVLSSLSGMVYDKPEKESFEGENEIQFADESNSSDGNEEITQMNSLYDGYECQYARYSEIADDDASELCSAIFDIGYQHNSGLYDVTLSAMDLGVSSTHDAEKDLMMLDRIVMNTGQIDYLQGHHNTRWITESILENSRYTSEDSGDEKLTKMIENGILGNEELCNLQPILVQGRVDVESANNFQQNCNNWLPATLSLMQTTYDTLKSGDNWLETLKVDDDSTELERVILPFAESVAHATAGYWGCDGHDSPDYADLPNHDCFNSFEEYIIMTSGRGGNDSGDEPWYANVWFPLAVFLDILGMIAVFLLLAAAVVYTIGIIIGPMLDNDSSTSPDWENATKAFKFIMDWGGLVPAIFGSFRRWVEETGDVTLNLDDDFKIGNVSIIGPDGWVQSQSDVAGGICPVEMQAKLMDADSSYFDGDPYLNYLWTVEKIGSSGGQWSSISNPNEHLTEILFWGTGTYRITVKVTSIHANVTPEDAVRTNYLISEPCVDPGSGDPPKPPVVVWKRSIIITPNDNNLDWKAHALADLELTMPSSEWVSNVCTQESWSDECFVAAVRAIHHNKFLGSTYQSYNELGLHTRLNSINAINNMDAAVVATNDSIMIDAYENGGRDFAKALLTETITQANLEENSEASIGLIQMKSLYNMGLSKDINRDIVEFLGAIISNWNDATAEQDYQRALEERMGRDDFSELPLEVRLNYYEQRAVFHSSDDIIELFGIPKWLQKLIDVGSIAVGSWAMVTSHGDYDEPTSAPGYNMVQSGLGSFQAIIFTDNTGVHQGFSGVEECSVNDVTDCIRARLEGNFSHFDKLRTAAVNNPTIACGESPSLAAISISSEDTYLDVASVEYMIIASCTINGTKYHMKNIVTSQSSGEVVYQYKTTEPWTELDNIQQFSIEIERLPVGNYCIDTILIEPFNPNEVANSTICFDVIKESQDTKDNKSDSAIPGFTVFMTFIALLAAVAISLRRKGYYDNE